MRTLIIPDIHLDHETAEKIISHVNAEQIIFLGDYFDDFNDTPDQIRSTAQWLKDSTKQKNRIHLIGNHDIHYMDSKFGCGGYAHWKLMLINEYISTDTWSKLKYYHVLDNMWLLSHAGLHDSYVPSELKSKSKSRIELFENISNYFNEEIIKGWRGQSWIFRAGKRRGGSQNVGGLIWCDFLEFKPVVGINQIFGHTPQLRNPKHISIVNDSFVEWDATSNLQITDRDSVNICLDVYSNIHYLVWDGKNIEINNSRDIDS